MEVQDATKDRLLEAAGEEFAEKGFECARIRAICERAQANIAAVNYHFGDKEQLYVAGGAGRASLRVRGRRGGEDDETASRPSSSGPSSTTSSAGCWRCTTRTTGGIGW